MGVQTEVLKSVDRLLVLADGGNGVAVLNGDHAIGATTLNITGTGTNFAANEPFRVGDGELMTRYHASSSAASSITIAAPGLRRAYKSGTPVQEMIADIHGPITEDGKISVTRDSSNVDVASTRLPFGLLRGVGKIEADLTIAALTMYALALALGMPKAKVLGAGTAADPFQIVNDGRDFGTNTNVCVVIEATRQDNTPVRFELYGVTFDYTAVNVQLARGVASQVPLKLVAAGMLVDNAATAFLTNAGTDYSVAFTDLLDGLTEFGYCTDATTGPLSTTTTAVVAAGANTFPLTAITNLAAGDIIKVFDPAHPERAEYHYVNNIATLNCICKTRSLRGFASGVSVVRQARNPLGTINGDGVKFTVGGDVADMKSGVADMVAGLRAGNADITFAWALQAYNLVTLALALGLPIPSGNYLEVLTGIGNTAIGCLYATGTTQGAKALWLLGWVNSTVVSADIPLSTSGEPAGIGGSAKPTSGFAIFAF